MSMFFADAPEMLTLSAPCPWRRYAARWLDLLIYGLLWNAIARCIFRLNLGSGFYANWLFTLVDTAVGVLLMLLIALVAAVSTGGLFVRINNIDNVTRQVAVLAIVGIGYTIYLGSEYESTMMAEAGELIAEAHAQGLIVVLWIYPRGKAVPDEKDPDLIAGAAGVALCLGADFVKVNPPKATDGQTSAEGLKIASTAAGRTGLVCAGGSKEDASVFLSDLYDQIHIGGACGNATGRNIHMRSTEEAVRLTKAISAITLGDYSVEDALAVFNGEKDFTI